MIVSIEELTRALETVKSDDTAPSQALWIRFSPEKTRKTVEYKTADENQLVHIYLDENAALLGIEIFP